jgi:hypothetical protein
MRMRSSGLLGANAWCDSCEFEHFTRNAMGLAAIHADMNPGHRTFVEQTISVSYVNENGER